MPWKGRNKEQGKGQRRKSVTPKRTVIHERYANDDSLHSRELRGAIYDADQGDIPILTGYNVAVSSISAEHEHVLFAGRIESDNATQACEDKTDDILAVIDRELITHRNSTESALLKLPPELRNYIWELAFGYCTVHPRALRGKIDWQPQRRRLQPSKWGVSYDPCLETQPDYDVYVLSQLDPNADCWHPHMHPELGAPGFHNCEPSSPRKFHYLVPPVCKQLWDEASDCIWKTVTFAFITSGDFQHFVHFSGARLDQITQLCIITPGIDFFAGRPLAEKDKFERGWERALRSGVMKSFTSLIGVHLVLRCFWGTSRWNTHTVENLEFPPDECLYLPEIIRSFQQLRLRPEWTTALVTNAESEEAYGWEHFTVPKRRKMAEFIRTLMLQEKPDRDWSGPGQRMMIWPRNSNV